ncbi:MAG: restriction endonuclease subunit R, partial [Candidatus Nephrothrix sp. EaCA]
DRFDIDIFTAAQSGQDLSKAGDKLKRHIYDYAITDSDVEQIFVKELDVCAEVVVYAKLPRGFHIPTPVGNYTPDWAISFKEGMVKHVYFVAETKGDVSSMVLNKIEETKTKCARRFFEGFDSANVEYGVVSNFGELMGLVK